MTSELTFWSGAGEVTGANFMLEYGEGEERMRVLVDCGVLQGMAEAEDRNAAPFPYEPSSARVLLVTHAHSDHIGRIPKLVRDGFNGRIISTHPTRDLAALMFDDALRVMAEDARLGRGEPIYDAHDAERALLLWETHGYGEAFSLGDASVRFADAGHILGAAMIRMERGSRTLVFSGDVGDRAEPVLDDAASLRGAHLLLMESVYGDRLHEGIDERRDLLRYEIEEVRKSGGTLLIPSFAIERTQVLLSETDLLFQSGTAPIPVFLNSPLARRVTEVYRKYPELLDENLRERIARGDDPFSFDGLTVVEDAEGSRRLAQTPGPKVIIAGSGMSEGGRVRAHEKQVLPDRNSRFLFVGFQAAGSLGRRIMDGDRAVVIDGERVAVRAHISKITGYSGHADRDGLLDLVASAGESLERVFVTMGEPKSSLFLAQRILDFLGVEAVVPERGQRTSIDW